MELKKIEIKNFRSIKHTTIDFDQNCKVLVGKNDAGKSNVLKAIAAVFGEYQVTSKDKRKRIGNEIISSTEYFVHAIFELNEDDFSDVFILFKQKYGDLELIREGLENEISNFIRKNFKRVLRRISIAENATWNKSYYLVNKSELKKIENLIFENGSISPGIPTTNQSISVAIFDCIKEHWKDYESKCYYWSYNKSFLLPNTVSILDFRADPNTCEPLKNVFELCNRYDISKQFTTALEEDGDYENLLEQVSQEVTSVFQEIWGDFKNTEIELRPNGTDISIKIKEKIKYNFEDRSDGFKKFISILLMISTRVRMDTIDHLDLVLFDEPDQSLYPTSAIFLRDELIKLSEKTKIIYSTHSQFMIDSECVERHIVVQKKDDITKLDNYDSISPFSNDELLRRAIGTSVFECLQEKNIIFEGWLDKELFECYLKSNLIKAKKFKNIGKVFLSGISSVEPLVQILTLANKKFIIVADSDSTSNNKRIDFCTNYPEYADNWISYADIGTAIETMEDFLMTEYVKSKLIERFSDYQYKTNISSIKNIENVITDKAEKQTFKKNLIKNLGKENIKQEYIKYIDLLIAKLAKQ